MFSATGQTPAATAKAPAEVDIFTAAGKKEVLSEFTKQAGQTELATLLKQAGPYTLLAPANDAFTKQQAAAEGATGGATANLKALVFEGRYDLTALLDAIRANNWKAPLQALDGSQYMCSIENGRVKITNASGASAFITSYNVPASNGVIHILDTVLPPK